MKNIIIYFFIGFLFISFKKKEFYNQNNDLTISYVQEINIIKDSENKPEKSISNFIGVFPKNNDTVKIFILDNKKNIIDKLSYWSKKEAISNVITFYNSKQDSVKVKFEKNDISVDYDHYNVNELYYKHLKQKIFYENSIIELATLLKEGYGDYKNFFLLLNKNWLNNKESKDHKILSARIKNKDFQTDNQYYSYSIGYKYNKKDELENVDGENRYHKTLVKNNKNFKKFVIEESQNERNSINEELYINKKTLFDSIIGKAFMNSNSNTFDYKRYQTKLKIRKIKTLPNNIDELKKFISNK